MSLCLKGYRFFGRAISLFLLLCTLFAPAVAMPDDSLLNELLKKAEDERLYNDRYWQVLLHYKPASFGLKSLIDDPNFFLSPYGKEDPKAELEATLRAFFESDRKDDDHPRCRFIARYEWLKFRLGIDDSAIPVACKEFSDMIDKTIQPKSAVLIFPAFFMNNPASMFGHTLIRVDSSYQSRLLSYATNYAAFPDRIGMLYPIKGIFGFYKGYFKIFPYYDMIRKYNDTEQRDMWEYRLDFTEEEVRRMLMHLWELKDIYSYYYFFDENCSYNLLFLLEAARPSLDFTDKTGLWVIPVDTIRMIKDSGIVESVEFRPAKATRIRHIASLLNGQGRKDALSIADGPSGPGAITDTEDRIKMLDLATEIIQYRYNKGDTAKDEYQRLFLATLKERSMLGNPDDDSYEIPVPALPEKGHLSSRFGLGAGVRRNAIFQEISYRPAYHSLTDQDDGYLEGSQIVFANAEMRHYSDGKVKLERFDLIDIVSISPRDDFFKPLSFKVKTGFTQTMKQEGEDIMAYQLNPGVGFAYKGELTGLYYALAEANLNVGGGFRDDYALGIGAEVGIIKKITDDWKVNLSAETIFYELGDRFQNNRASIVQTLSINQSNSINLSVSGKKVANNKDSEVALDWNYYF